MMGRKYRGWRKGGESTAMETRVSRSGCAFDAVIRWTNVQLGPIFRERGRENKKVWQPRNKRFVVVPPPLCFSRPLHVESSCHPRVILLLTRNSLRTDDDPISKVRAIEFLSCGNSKGIQEWWWLCITTLAHESRTDGRILGEKVG